MRRGGHPADQASAGAAERRQRQRRRRQPQAAPAIVIGGGSDGLAVLGWFGFLAVRKFEWESPVHLRFGRAII